MKKRNFISLVILSVVAVISLLIFSSSVEAVACDAQNIIDFSAGNASYTGDEITISWQVQPGCGTQGIYGLDGDYVTLVNTLGSVVRNLPYTTTYVLNLYSPSCNTATLGDPFLCPVVASRSETATVAHYCGDNVCDAGMENTTTCGADCNPLCGDGVTQTNIGEQCDDGSDNTNTCPANYGQVNVQYCTTSCTDAVCAGDTCGDGTTQNPPEQCDDGNTVNTDSCKNDCTLNLCGNGVVNSGEQCDGTNLNGKSCTTNPPSTNPPSYTGGTLSCKSDCTFNTSLCTTNLCGNGVLNAGEQCEVNPLNLNGGSCQNQGYTGGTLGCYSTNCQYDTSSCTGTSQTCGNGIREGTEVCDLGTGNGACPATCSTSCTTNDCNVPATCSLTSAGWSTPTYQATEGDVVSLIVQGTDCSGKTVSFTVWEDDPFPLGDDPVNISPVNVTFSGNTATGAWTTEWQSDGSGDNIPEYYFIATVIGAQGSPISSSTSEAQELKVNRSDLLMCSGVATCGDYSTVEACTLDSCSVASNGVPGSVGCGTGGTSCWCYWNEVTSNCDTNVDNTAGRCIYTQSSGDTCEDDGFLTFSWTAQWIWNEGKTAADDPTELHLKCIDGSKTVECPAQIALPYFTFYNVAAAVILIALVYWALATRGKKAVNKTRNKKKRI